MASGTDGNIISYDASGNPVAIVTGDDGQVLTSTGAGSPPAFEAVPAGSILHRIDHASVSGDVTISDTTDHKGTTFGIQFERHGSASKFVVQVNWFSDNDFDVTQNDPYRKTYTNISHRAGGSAMAILSASDTQNASHLMSADATGIRYFTSDTAAAGGTYYQSFMFFLPSQTVQHHTIDLVAKGLSKNRRIRFRNAQFYIMQYT
jgi:hypothetical protein